MKNLPLYLIICLFLLSCGGSDKHPDYPMTFVDNVNIRYVGADSSDNQYRRYTSVIVEGKTLYLLDSCLYDIRGNLVKTSRIKQLLPCFENGYRGEITSSGYFVFECDDLYLFDLENDRLVKEIMKVRFNRYKMDNLSAKLKQRLDSLQLQLPDIPLMRGHWMYADRYPEDREKFDKQVKDNYEKPVMDFIAKNKNEGYLFSSKFGDPCLVFPEKGVVFMLDNITIEEFPPFSTGHLFTPAYGTEEPPVSIRHTESVFLGYGKHNVFGIPFPESNGYIHYYEFVCDGEVFNFKNKSGNMEDNLLYDYEQTDDKIYFAMASHFSNGFNDVYLCEYKRKIVK